MKKVYGVVLEGFEGGTDHTDHLIEWVQADNKLAVTDHIIGLGWKWISIELIDLGSLAASP